MKLPGIIALNLICSLFLAALHAQPDPDHYHAISRLDYYSVEKTGEIAVYIPESKSNLAITIDLVFEFQFLQKGAQVIPHGFSGVPFSLELMRKGDNEVTVSFYENGKWVDSRKVNVKIRESVPNEVKTDRITGLLMTGGLPFLPVGQEVRLPADFALLDGMAGGGITMVAPEAEWVRKACRMNRMAFMDRCDALGLKVNYDVSGFAALDGTPGFSDKELGKLQKEIHRLREHPALLTWTLAADPVATGLPPEALWNAFQVLKSADPHHPVCMHFQSPEQGLDYLEVADMMMFDEFFKEGDPSAERSLALLDRYGVPVWSCPCQDAITGPVTGALTEQMFRHRVYNDLSNGASGFQRKGGGGDWGKQLPLELMELAPVLASGDATPPVGFSDPQVKGRVFNMNGLFVIVVVNHSMNAEDFSVQLGELDLTIEGMAIFEGRKVKMNESRITDVIFGEGVKVYVFDNRMKPDWKKYILPGNLTLNPGFELTSSPARPMHVTAPGDAGHGTYWFADGRLSRQGDRSIRLNTSGKGRGTILRMDAEMIETGRDYVVSVWAKGIAGRNEMRFSLSLGAGASREFTLSGDWEEYRFTVPSADLEPDNEGFIRPALQLVSKGAAWFDVLQLTPAPPARP